MRNSRMPRSGGQLHRRAALLLALSLLLFLFSTRTLMRVPAFFKGYVLGGIQKGFAAVGGFIGQTIDAARELGTLRNEYELLLKKVQELESREREYSMLKEENARLREQLGLASVIAPRKIAAKIIARDPGNTYPSLVLDKGEYDGVRKNMPVIAFQKGSEGLVGRIIEVRATTSVVQPLHDRKFHAAVRLASTRSEGLVEGNGARDLPLTLLYVPKSDYSQIARGDIALTSGLDGIYPPEIMVGRVDRVTVDETTGSLRIDLLPAIDMGRLEYVFMLETEVGRNEADSIMRGHP